MTRSTTYSTLDKLIVSAVQSAPVPPAEKELLAGDIRLECMRLQPILDVPSLEVVLSRRVLALRRKGRIRSRGRCLMV